MRNVLPTPYRQGLQQRIDTLLEERTLLGAVSAVLCLQQPRSAQAANDRFEDYILCTGPVAVGPQFEVWVVLGKTLKQINCPFASDIVGNHDVVNGGIPQYECDDVICIYIPG